MSTASARVLRDSWVITRRDLEHWGAQPAPVVISLLFPVMTVLMFGYLFGGALSVPGGGSYREFLVPGMLVLTMVFGIEMTMIAVVTDAARGVTDRFRSLPMASSAVLLGRSGADMLNSVAGLAVMLGCGLAIGWQARQGPADALAAIGLLLLLRFALIWLGVYLGLVINSPEAITGAQILVWPLGFLSNAFVAPATMPGWPRDDRRVEPAIGHRVRRPRAVRQPWHHRRIVGHRPRRDPRGGLAPAADRGVPATVRAPLPPAQPMIAVGTGPSSGTGPAVSTCSGSNGEIARS